MGGKGGGGGEPGWMPVWRAEQARLAKEKADQDARDEAARVAAAAKLPEPKAAAPEPEAPKPEPEPDPGPPDPLGPAIDPGGAIEQPDQLGSPSAFGNTLAIKSPFGAGAVANTTGDVLGGAVAEPAAFGTAQGAGVGDSKKLKTIA